MKSYLSQYLLGVKSFEDASLAFCHFRTKSNVVTKVLPAQYIKESNIIKTYFARSVPALIK
jgi:hypothetical protein